MSEGGAEGRRSKEEEVVVDTVGTAEAEKNHKLKDRNFLPRVDSFNLEAGTGRLSMMGWRTTLSLAFQSIGVVYGDIGTSPLYVYSSTFPKEIKNHEDILGILSIIIYTILFVPLLKYVFIVLWANDNGNGGAFALYSLICRHMKMALIPNEQSEDRELSNYKLQMPSTQIQRADNLKQKLEGSHIARIGLLLLAIVGASMVIGDGILTPTMSVLSAVSGISTSLGQDAVVGLSIAILVVLFYVQRFGTNKVGFSFAPIILVWFLLIGGIGLYNLFKYDIGVLRAFNPKYIYDYFKRNGKEGWISLGGAFLCITGSEAMFADLGHFNIRAIQISFSCITCPAILVAYIGQAAYLRKFPQNVTNTFYASIPHPLYWPTFVVAVAASIIASQAMISASFSIISQALNLGCFPRVRVVHTSVKHQGQVYIAEVNYVFMIACIVVCATFKTTEKISHAYGIAVVGDMMITTTLVSLIMFVLWKKSVWLVGLFFLGFGFVEVVYFSAQLTKLTGGGYLPIVSATFLTGMMGIWHYVDKQRYMFELKNKVSSGYLKELANNPDVRRVPGIGLLYSELVQGIPPIFPHLIGNIPSFHSIVVFVSIKAIPVSRVASEEMFLFQQVEPREYRIFRCVVRHGYSDVLEDPAEFESQLIGNLKAFIQQENYYRVEVEGSGSETETATQPAQFESDDESGAVLETQAEANQSSWASPNSILSSMHGDKEEVKFIEKALEKGAVHMLAEAEVVAHPNSSIFNKIVVDYVYSFFPKNFRQGQNSMKFPPDRLLKVGMTYQI